MILSDENLLLYADGELSAEDAARVEEALAGDGDAAQRLAAIRRGGEALAGVGDSDLDSDAVASLAAMIRSRDTISKTERAFETRQPTRNWMRMAAGIALFIGGTVFGIVAGDYVRPADPPPQKGWIARVIDYQSLYGRDTIDETLPPVASYASIATDLSQRFGRNVSVPDLAEAGLDFQRGQVLEFKDKPLIQMSYLPRGKGRPVALCLIATDRADAAPDFSVREGLNVVRWVKNGVDHVLVGWQDEAEMREAASLAMAQLHET